MWTRLQPYVAEAATVGGGGCNRMWPRLQPYVTAHCLLSGLAMMVFATLAASRAWLGLGLGLAG